MLIVMEGLDGCGKETQSLILNDKLNNQKYNAKVVSSPNYNSKSCEPLKMYLNGELGVSPSEVNPYPASSFFSIDRFINFKLNWEKDYRNDYIIICDRYTTSNMIYQTVKIDIGEQASFLEWLCDLEYVKFKIPAPDMVIYLDMKLNLSDALLKKRYGGKNVKKDIHELNHEYLGKCQEIAHRLAKKFGWYVVNCQDNSGNICSKERISEKIWEYVKNNIQ